MASIKRKLHLNWDGEQGIWVVKKSFGFLAPSNSFTQDTLKTFLLENNDVEIVAKYF